MLVSVDRTGLSFLVGPLGLAVRPQASRWLPTFRTDDVHDARHGFRCRTWSVHWLGVHAMLSWVSRGRRT